MRNSIESARLLRRKMGENSILDFAKIYFPHYLMHPSPPFHEEICKILKDMSCHRNGRLAIAAPRGYAKSTIVNTFYVIWSICYSKENFIAILSATAKQAQGFLYGISKELQTNDLLLSDFADILTTNNQIKTKWAQDEIVTPNDITVASYGAGQDIRGIKRNQFRPTLIILDDVDGANNTYGAQSREKIFNWFTQVVLKLGVLKGLNVVAVGTLLHTNSLLSRLTRKEEFPSWDSRIYRAVEVFSAREDLWQKWNNILFSRGESYNDEVGLAGADKFFQDNKKDMLENTKVLWEEQEDYYTLMKIKFLETSYSFDSEKQNDPKNAKECRYDPEKFHYWDDKFSTEEALLQSFGSEYSYIGACDPSVGVASINADYSAIIILIKHKGKLYVIDADITQRSQENLVQAIVNYCDLRKPMDKFVIEANLFPELLLETIKKHAYKENVMAPFKEIRNTKNKELRIFGMETYITTGTILFSRKQTVLLEQLKYFPRGDHDDGPDALEMALREAEVNKVSFLPLDEDEIRDKHGRRITDRDFGQTTPEEDAQNDDDEEY